MTRSFALLLALAAGAPAESYFFGFLKSAPDRKTLPKEEAEKIQSAHLAHLGAMNERGGLVCAGPLAGGGVLRGVIIYKIATLAEAQANADADPAVKAGQLVAELFPWTGPAAIGEEFRQRYQASGGKMQMKMVKYHLLLAKPGFSATGAVAAGPYRQGDLTGDLLIFPERTQEARKALEGDHVRVLLDWYVAEGVLPKP
jgi:uncharacterized protein YciI